MDHEREDPASMQVVCNITTGWAPGAFSKRSSLTMLCGSFERVANSSNSPREIILQIQRASEIWKRSLLLPENSKPALADHPQTRHTAGLAINDDPFALREIIEYRIRCSLSETVERSKLLLPNWINLKRNSPKSPRSPINGLDFYHG